MSSEDIGALKARIAELEKENAALHQNDGETEREILDSLLVNSTFISKLCHDLRSPLNAVLGFSQLCNLKAETLSPEKIKRYSSDIELAGNDLLHIITYLHSYAKLVTNRMPLQPEDADVPELFSALNKKFTSLAATHQNTLLFKNNLVTNVKWDVERVKSILEILIHNSLKFTENGDIEVQVKNVNNDVVISVKDNGEGMDREHSERAFDEQYQLSHAHERRSGGTGLGLAVLKRTVNLLKGNVQISTEAGVGTTISVVLPAS